MGDEGGGDDGEIKQQEERESGGPFGVEEGFGVEAEEGGEMDDQVEEEGEGGEEEEEPHLNDGGREFRPARSPIHADSSDWRTDSAAPFSRRIATISPSAVRC